MPQEFFDGIFGRKPMNQYLLLWVLPQKHSFWYKGLSLAADAARQLCAQDRDVYVGVGLRPKMYGTNIRGANDDISGIVALWADVDYMDPVHAKENLPPTRDAAAAFLSSLALPPTCIVHSGHGLQAWWVLEKPWMFSSDEDRMAAKLLTAQWHGHLQAEAKKQGWDVDATHDLARVLRVAGTTNYKSAPAPVRIMESKWERRYTLAQVREVCGDIKVAQAERAVQRDVTLKLDPDAVPPFDKWGALKESDPKIEASWERKRDDFQDRSGSAYDMSLATYAVMAGWTDQEIANLLIAARRKHSDDLKLRQDYYQRTIRKAREAREGDARVFPNEVLSEIGLMDGEPLTPESREQLLAYISDSIGVPIVRVVKYLASEPSYRLETSLGGIVLGDVDGLIMQGKLRLKIAAATGRYMKKFTPAQWDTLAQGLLNSCEEEEIGDEATEIGAAKGYLIGYLNAHTLSHDPRDAAVQQHPYFDEGRVHIFGTALRKWLQVAQGERLTAKAMGTMLSALKCVPVIVAVKLEDGRMSTRQSWQLPPEFSSGKRR